MPMLICNRFHERLANIGKIATFTGVAYSSLMLLCAGFLEPRKSRLGPSKSTFDAENFIRSFSTPISILAQFALEMCLTARNLKKIYKNLYFSLQGHPKSWNSVAIESQCKTSY